MVARPALSGNHKLPALKRARENALINARKVRTTVNKAWRTARRSETFSKPFKTGASAGGVRSNPLVSKHAFKVAAAGASKCVLRELREDAHAMRLPLLSEPSKSPWITPVTQGAEVMLEQFIAAIVQHGMRNAGVIRECAGRKKASYTDAMKGLELAVKSTFSGDLGDMHVITTSAPPVRKSNAKGKSGKSGASAAKSAAEAAAPIAEGSPDGDE